ncbi:MAG TPA: DegQ family serine endoprotease [Stellaceae bacterium]|nr:DegQ family serine endoprotease [Stellaceae bacterium]
MIRTFAVVALIAALAGPAQAQTRAVPESREAVKLSYAPIVKRVAPAVVNVYSRRVVRQQPPPLLEDPFFRRFFGQNVPFGMSRERVLNSLGSGVIVDPNGLIVTNGHVINEAQEIRVVLSDRREFEAKVKLLDEHADLAVLTIDTHGEKLPALELGDSDTLEVGDIVLAIGNPFGVGQTVTTGIVSAVARSIGASDFRSFIQTDAAINPGNSGGALVDLDGKLVGINTAIFSRSGGSMGLGFAIPSAMVRVEIDAAHHGGKVTRPWLGAAGQEVTPELAEGLKLERPAGVLVKDIVADSPAAAAGLRVGDVILAVNGHPVDDPQALKFRIATLPPNAPAKVVYWRSGESHSTSVTLALLPEDPPRALKELSGANPLAGATVGNLNPAFDDDLGFDTTVRGVVVASLEQGSAAQRLGLEPGDVLVSLNKQPVDTVAGLESVLGSAEPPWTIAVRRKGKLLTVTVR